MLSAYTENLVVHVYTVLDAIWLSPSLSSSTFYKVHIMITHNDLHDIQRTLETAIKEPPFMDLRQTASCKKEFIT